MTLPIGNIENDGDMRFTLMGIVAQKRCKIVLVGYPKDAWMRLKIDQFIKTLHVLDSELNIIRIDEDYSSVQAQVITGETGKNIAHDTLSAMELITRYLHKNSQ